MTRREFSAADCHAPFVAGLLSFALVALLVVVVASRIVGVVSAALGSVGA